MMTSIVLLNDRKIDKIHAILKWKYKRLWVEKGDSAAPKYTFAFHLRTLLRMTPNRYASNGNEIAGRMINERNYIDLVGVRQIYGHAVALLFTLS